MKNNLPITNTERSFDGELRIVSTTDKKGITTYANENFIALSGFSEEELYGKNHNIVRHPDMPPIAFTDLWATIKTGKPWMGIVKNRCKNGDYYWVDAYVTPIFDAGEIVGYQSVRTTPRREHVNTADSLYRKIRENRFSVLDKLAWLKPGTRGKLIITQFCSLLAVFILLLVSGISFSPVFLAAIVLLSGMSVFAIYQIMKPWKKAAAQARSIFKNDIARTVYTRRSDELGDMQLTILALQAKLKTILVRVNDTISVLNKAAGTSREISEGSSENARKQLDEISQVATAMNEMSAAVHEIARRADMTSKNTDSAKENAQKGALTATEALGAMEALVQRVEITAAVIQELSVESNAIGGMVDVIRDIAEQTNLLALNAAIEAARAGEQGRGFAVVADEVRTLASRTQQSTGEIQKIVEQLQQRAGSAVEEMSKASEQGSLATELVESAAAALAEVSGSVVGINDMNTEVAAATEEQGLVAEEINRSISNISNLAEETVVSATSARQASEELENETARLNAVVWQFGD
ncbi:Methyl-accepting chemotaxis sensor/transducer protein [hydrothermal vent metagenome]|uniref:Methyl-accepting chemotaxis sensor/transducer protein n=1 Tax=hydrothermal vent metagenome TaxID=652676 RepID=A0A3B1BT05_9ZZZZ